MADPELVEALELDADDEDAALEAALLLEDTEEAEDAEEVLELEKL